MAMTRADGAKPRHRNRVQQAFQEFLLIPMCVVAGWLACAGVVVAFDRGLLGGTGALGHALSSVVPPQSTTILLRAIVPGLITMISIVFFVLVMAVQHQSSSYSPVVFDQFLRRHSNQAFFGVLIGETAYNVLVLTLIPTGHTVLAGTVSLAGLVLTLIMMLAFIYSTVDQMRPSAIVWMIQHLALEAREGQDPLLARCHMHSTFTDEDEDVPALPVHVDESGYITHIDGQLLARELCTLPEDMRAEVDFVLSMGDHMVPGMLLGYVRGGDRLTRDRLAGTMIHSLTLGRMPDIDHDSGHAVDHLGNIAWSAASTSDPEGARVAIRTLHALLAHWGHQPSSDPKRYGGLLPIVYRDRSVTKVLNALTSVVVGSLTNGQHQSCAYALRGLAEVLPRLSTMDQDAAVDQIQRVLPTASRHVFTHDMEAAVDAVHDALNVIGKERDRDRVGEIRREFEHQYRLAAPASVAESQLNAQGPDTDGAETDETTARQTGTNK